MACHACHRQRRQKTEALSSVSQTVTIHSIKPSIFKSRPTPVTGPNTVSVHLLVVRCFVLPYSVLACPFAVLVRALLAFSRRPATFTSRVFLAFVAMFTEWCSCVPWYLLWHLVKDALVHYKNKDTLQLCDRRFFRNSSLQAVCDTPIVRITGCVPSYVVFVVTFF